MHVTTASASVGELLRDWRQRRRLTQMDLALEADISSRHLSFVETGRAQPSRHLLTHLSEVLEVPLRERNRILMAGGFAPIYAERSLDDDALATARAAIDIVVAAQKPYPAFALDRHWNIAVTNQALPELYDGVAPALMQPPVNALRASLHPQGIAARIVNLAEWRAHLLFRLRKQIDLTGDETLRALLHEVLSYSYDGNQLQKDKEPHIHHSVLVPLTLHTPLGLLSFFSTTTVFGTPVDVTLSELAIEMFFPADAETDRLVRGHSTAAA
jgi:transcriptional regulator with XRE-family HTH domain